MNPNLKAAVPDTPIACWLENFTEEEVLQHHELTRKLRQDKLRTHKRCEIIHRLRAQSMGDDPSNLSRSLTLAQVASRHVRSPASHYPAETRESRSVFRVRLHRQLGHRSNRAEQERLELALGCSLIRFGQSSSRCPDNSNRDSHTSNPSNKGIRNRNTPILDTNTERTRKKTDDDGAHAPPLRHVGASHCVRAMS